MLKKSSLILLALVIGSTNQLEASTKDPDKKESRFKACIKHIKAFIKHMALVIRSTNQPEASTQDPGKKESRFKAFIEHRFTIAIFSVCLTALIMQKRSERRESAMESDFNGKRAIYSASLIELAKLLTFKYDELTLKCLGTSYGQNLFRLHISQALDDIARSQNYFTLSCVLARFTEMPNISKGERKTIEAASKLLARVKAKFDTGMATENQRLLMIDTIILISYQTKVFANLILPAGAGRPTVQELRRANAELEGANQRLNAAFPTTPSA